MPAPKPDRPGKRISVYLPYEHANIASKIDNLSNFFQLALEQAVGIMALDIVKQAKGLEQPLPTDEQYDRWNRDHPLDPLTAKRMKKWPNTQSSQPKQELW